jgi:hypothetical protein
MKVKVKMALCLTKHHAIRHFLLNQAPRHEDVLGNGGIASRILHLGTRRKRVVRFTPRPLYSWGKDLSVPIG